RLVCCSQLQPIRPNVVGVAGDPGVLPDPEHGIDIVVSVAGMQRRTYQPWAGLAFERDGYVAAFAFDRGQAVGSVHRTGVVGARNPDEPVGTDLPLPTHAVTS